MKSNFPYLVLLAVFGAIVSARFVMWRRARLTIPRYVHVLAVLGCLLGLGLVLLDRGVNAFDRWESVLLPVVLTLLVYYLFGARGSRVMDNRAERLRRDR